VSYRLGIDIGGTFTDFALVDDATGRIATHKQLTTPDDPSRCVLTGTRRLLDREGVPVEQVSTLIHGTTLVTNAVIERKGAGIGMLVTAGFADVLEIAMERRYDLFDLRLKFAPPVVPRRARAEIAERIRYDGRLELAVDLAEARAAVVRLVEEQKIAALSVCFLHAYANPANERAVAEMVRRDFPDLYVSTSSDVLPFMREYERWTTTTINAYAQPMTDRYLGRIEAALEEMGFKGAFLIMTSSGGTVTADLARRFPVRLVESGPAAGVLMSAYIGGETKQPDLLSFDMGGTTAKGALVREGRPLKKYEMEVGRQHDFKAGSGLLLRIPVIDMIEIGAGGGSIAESDKRGLLRVGPRSAGADPGPACYGQGGSLATLTDANTVIGLLDPKFFLGGQMALDVGKAEAALTANVGTPLGIDLARAAWGVHEIINEDVARAFRIHASELGFDYRSCAMVAFGGSGPLHALRIARKLRIPRVIFPAGAGVMSAIGMLVTPLSFETLRSRRVQLSTLKPGDLAAGFAELVEQASSFLAAAGVPKSGLAVQRSLDMRYVGQGYEVEVALADGLDEQAALAELPRRFADAYAEVFSTSFLEQPLEIVNWKVAAVGPQPSFAGGYQVAGFDPARTAEKGSRRMLVEDRTVDCPVYDRYALVPGTEIAGPALIEENESTCVIGPGDRVRVDDRLNLIADLAYA